MLRHKIIEDRGSVILKTIDTHPITGYWHRHRIDNLMEDDKGAIDVLDRILDIKYIPAPTTANYEKYIRDEYLPAVYNEKYWILLGFCSRRW